MKTFDIESNKYSIMLGLICIIFAVFIFKAFQYLPDNTAQPANDITKTNMPFIPSSQQAENADDKQGETANGENADNKQQKENVKEPNNLLVEEVDVENSTPKYKSFNEQISAFLTDEEKATRVLLKARELQSLKSYQDAITEFQKIPTMTKSKDLIAQSYDGLCEIYGNTGRIPDALSYAKMANDTYSTPQRQFSIALYNYKLGDKQDAFDILEILLDGKK